MKELSSVIYGRGEVRGFVFTQLFRSSCAYMYEKRDISSGVLSYEVFRRVENRSFDCVSYPRSSGFGGSIYRAKDFGSYSRAYSWFLHLSS